MKIKILILFVCINFTGFAQSKLVESYWTRDSLTNIILLKNQKVVIDTYSNLSPFMESNRKKRRKKTSGLENDLKGFTLLESGYGNYSKINDSLQITFESVTTNLDSISFHYLPTETYANNVTLNFIPKSFDSYNFSIGNDLEVRSMGNPPIIVNNLYDENVILLLKEDQIPIELIINDNFPVTISKFQNQNIEIFFNNYIRLPRPPKLMSNRSYIISNLIKINP